MSDEENISPERQKKKIGAIRANTPLDSGFWIDFF